MTGLFPIVRGPSYRMSRDPSLIPESLRQRAQKVERDALDPVNLYNIHWYDRQGNLRRLLLPPELTGVEANIIVLLGKDFPSGSHKVGPAYFTLVENELQGRLQPGMEIIGPSTGNFGIGTAYVATLKGYASIIVMPEGMSAERYERIKRYRGKLDLTPGSESDVNLVLDRVQAVYAPHPERYLILGQFELLQNYRFHRFVTGDAVRKAVQGIGNGRVAAFVAAPGSAGTLAAGDEVKAYDPEARVVALEPYECSTLYDCGLGSHKIEGIGDKMVVLIHNLLTTDLIMLIHDQDCLDGLFLLEEWREELPRVCGLPSSVLPALRGVFGISSLCNVLGAIKTARYLQLGPRDNVVTVATDGIDRYYSVLQAQHHLCNQDPEAVFQRIFRSKDLSGILEVDAYHRKRLFNQKAWEWKRRGYTDELLEAMKHQDYWDEEYARITDIDAAIEACAEPLLQGG